MPRESALVQRIRKAVRAKYPRAFVMKIADRYTRGVPDLLIVFRRRISGLSLEASCLDQTGVLFVETKTKDGVLSEIQKETLRRLYDIAPNGCAAVVATNSEMVLDILDAMGAVG